MNWLKLGLLYNVKSNGSWRNSHAALPTPLHLKDDVYRIYYSTRDVLNHSHGSFVDIDILTNEIIYESSKPLLSPGSRGLFSDSGITLSCFIPENGVFYYMGWSLMQKVPFANHIGGARWDNGILKPMSNMPLITKCEEEPYSFGYPWVLYRDGLYRVWYDSIMAWHGDTVNHYQCSLRCAESIDGINWTKNYVDCLDMRKGERCIARPMVIFEENRYKMWYSINFEGKYSIGYAESYDGINWIRKDNEVGITLSKEGWDSEEIEYPFVFDHKGERYMLYNGNQYGKTGFGIARLIR